MLKMEKHCPRTLQLIRELDKLSKFSIALVVIIVASSILLYSSYKMCAENHLYKTHKESYQYLISGVYLKSPEVSGCLSVFYVIVLFMLVHFGYCGSFTPAAPRYDTCRQLLQHDFIRRSFVGIAGDDGDGMLNSPNFNSRIKGIQKSIFRCIVIGSFAIISFLVNALYILAKESVPPNELVLVQLGILVFNVSSMYLIIPVLISRLYKPIPNSHQDDTMVTHVTRRVVYAAILSLINIMTPCFATFFTDDLCLHQYFVGSGKELLFTLFFKSLI